MADVVFVPDIAGWAKAFKGPTGIVADWIGEVTGDVEAATRFEAPGPGKVPRNRTGINYGTGQLMGSIGSRVEADGVGEVEGHVYAKPEHTKYVIHGTAPHVIRARPGGMLRFYWFRKAKWMVLPKVNHPGTAANDFMTRGLKKGLAANGIT